jgi:hypothetical protein
MGLIRSAVKMVPYIAVGILGYYLGTIKSDQYEYMFNNCVSEYNMNKEFQYDYSKLNDLEINVTKYAEEVMYNG